LVVKNTTQLYAQYVHYILHNMFRPILGHLQVVLFSLESKVPWWQSMLSRWWDLIHLFISLLWRVCAGRIFGTGGLAV